MFQNSQTVSKMFASYQQCLRGPKNADIFWRTLVTVCLFCLFGFGFSHLRGCDVVSHHGFELHFLVPNDVCRYFMCLLTIYLSSLEKCMFKSCDQFLMRLFVFMLVHCKCSLYILKINTLPGYKSLIWYIRICKYCLLFCGLFFLLTISLKVHI